MADEGTAFLHIVLHFVFGHFVILGVLISSAARLQFCNSTTVSVATSQENFVRAEVSWFVANNYMRAQSFHGVEQKMAGLEALVIGLADVKALQEWMYAFDIHCNSFFPLFLVLYAST